MIKKTDNFFVIHNFNTIPDQLLQYCNNYIVYDASTDEKILKQLEHENIKRIHIENTGHNITSYFSYFAEFYDELPEVICILKGNLIGRHCTKEYFEKVYDNHYFTYLYEDKLSREKFDKSGYEKSQGLSFLATESHYIEKNNSWYVDSPNHPHRFFDNLDDLLRCIYVDPVIPYACVFAPGACYVVTREQVKKHTKEFYLNLNKIMNYGLNPNFPSEAHHVERILPILFESSYKENTWMNSSAAFDEKLVEYAKKVAFNDSLRGKRFKRIRKLLLRGK